ncbi:MAG: S41 family peptidase [Proteobacteria bacterium]|nr:S41 family peptidase [Pseudomonadota bacterium]
MTKFRVLAMAGFLTFATPLAVGAQTADKKADPDTFRMLNLFGDVFERVRADYVERPTDEQLVENAINGMLQALDPHSSYLNSKSFRDMQVQTRGEFGGLGIEVTLENGLVKVVSPIDDTPAARAGIEPNDLITHLDGQAVQGMGLAEAVETMRGPVGSQLRLTIRREGREPFDVAVTRAVIKIQSVRARTERDVGVIRLTQFTEQTDQGLARAIEKIKTDAGANLKGYVLDLRNNPGGLLDQAVAVSDAFLDKGEIVSTRSRRPEDTHRFNAKPGDLTDGKPIVVLVNGGSASASEIVAGALQDHRRAIVLGTKTFGKGSVQTLIPLAGHGAMRLTTARYYTPSGRSIQALGIDPDINVEQARLEVLEQTRARREADLRGALRNDNGSNPAAPVPAPRTTSTVPGQPGATTPTQPGPGVVAEAGSDAAPQDYQMERAIDMLRGLALFARKTG